MSLDERLTSAAHHVADRVVVPVVDLATIRDSARAKRRRTAALGAVTCVALVAVGVGVARGALSGGGHAQTPIQQPSPTVSESGSAAEEWTPERIRGEGTPGDEIPATESGLTWRQYVVCVGSHCDGVHGPPEETHVALEVSQDGQSALYGVRGGAGQAWVGAFDADSVLVKDAEAGVDQPVRYRLLQADGSASELQMTDDPAPATPGRGVVVIDFGEEVMAGAEDVFLVDDRAGTLRPLDVPDERVRYWGPNVEEFLWGVTDDCQVIWAAAGTLEQRRLDCQDDMLFSFMSDAWFRDGWLRPGRMVLAEQREPTSDTPVVLHVTLDGGSTWQEIPLDNEHADVRDALRQIG